MTIDDHGSAMGYHDSAMGCYMEDHGVGMSYDGRSWKSHGTPVELPWVTMDDHGRAMGCHGRK